MTEACLLEQYTNITFNDLGIMNYNEGGAIRVPCSLVDLGLQSANNFNHA